MPLSSQAANYVTLYYLKCFYHVRLCLFLRPLTIHLCQALPILTNLDHIQGFPVVEKMNASASILLLTGVVG